jgi:hypothetical protein
MDMVLDALELFDLVTLSKRKRLQPSLKTL